MENDDPIEQYNSDSGDGDFQMDDMSDEEAGNGRGNGNGEAEGAGVQGWI